MIFILKLFIVQSCRLMVLLSKATLYSYDTMFLLYQSLSLLIFDKGRTTKLHKSLIIFQITKLNICRHV